MAVLYHQVWIKASTARLYEAISTEDGIGSWWDRPRAATSGADDVILEFNPGPEHGVLRVKILEMSQDRRVRWQIISTHPRNSPASAWTGTQVLFEIASRLLPPWASEKTSMAILDFRHSGWDENSEYLGFCNFGWGEALQKLKQRCESQ